MLGLLRHSIWFATTSGHSWKDPLLPWHWQSGWLPWVGSNLQKWLLHFRARQRLQRLSPAALKGSFHWRNQIGKGVFFAKKGRFFRQKKRFLAKKNSYRQTPEFLPPKFGFFLPKKLGKVALKKLHGVFLPKIWAILVRHLVSNSFFWFLQFSQFVLHQSWQGSSKREKGDRPCQHKSISALGVCP